MKYDIFEPYHQAAEELYYVQCYAAKTPLNRRQQSRMLIRRSVMSRASNNCLTGSSPRVIISFIYRSAFLDERDGKALPHSPCIRCNAFDGYPCLTNGKADAQIVCVDPALRIHSNLTLLTNYYVEKLTTDSHGGRISGVEVLRGTERTVYSVTSSSWLVARYRRRS